MCVSTNTLYEWFCKCMVYSTGFDSVEKDKCVGSSRVDALQVDQQVIE